MTDNIVIQTLEDGAAKSVTEANKIRFREKTYMSLMELAAQKGMKKKLTTKKLEKENQKLRDDNDRLKKIVNNNSDNSSKPPSRRTIESPSFICFLIQRIPSHSLM